jgi:lysophospholipase L1-like esterase
MNRISSNWNWKKYTAFFVTTLVAIELVMRAIGFVLLAPSDHRNEVRPEDEKMLRILAIGESTTADYFAGEESPAAMAAGAGAGAWPRRLENELRRAGIKARVYNEGLSGTSSPIIVSRVSDYIEKYRPQIVISMIGINDHLNLMYDNSFLFRFRLALSQIRILKLAGWINEFSAQTSCKFDTSFLVYSEHNKNLIVKGLDLAGKIPLSKVEKELRKITADEKELALVLSRISVKLRGDFSQTSGQVQSRSYIDRAFELNPYNHKIAFWAMNGQLSQTRCLEIGRKLLECGRNVPDDVLSEISMCSRGDESIKDESAFHSRGLILLKSASSLRSYHYRILHDLLSREKIFHVAMQYPTLTVEELKSYFSNKNDVTFVSNQENFSAALNLHPYQEVFEDRFRGSWGHTTAIGDQLIANAALESILNLLKLNQLRFQSILNGSSLSKVKL